MNSKREADSSPMPSKPGPLLPAGRGSGQGGETLRLRTEAAWRPGGASLTDVGSRPAMTRDKDKLEAPGGRHASNDPRPDAAGPGGLHHGRHRRDRDLPRTGRALQPGGAPFSVPGPSDR